MFEVKITNTLIQTLCPSLDKYSKFEEMADQHEIAPAFQPVIDAYQAVQNARLALLDAYFMRDKTVSFDEIDRYTKESSKFYCEAREWAEFPLSDKLKNHINASQAAFEALAEKVKIEEARFKHMVQNGEELSLDDFNSLVSDCLWMTFDTAAILNTAGEEIVAHQLSAATPTTH